MAGNKPVTINFLMTTGISVVLALTAVHLLLKLMLIIQKFATYDISRYRDFLTRKNLCTTACPGAMNCTEWMDCIFHQPDNCNELKLLCDEGDFTLFSAEAVLMPLKQDTSWEITTITLIEIFTFLLAIGMLIMGAWCFYSLVITLAVPAKQNIQPGTRINNAHVSISSTSTGIGK